jgi:hypothetical protein
VSCSADGFCGWCRLMLFRCERKTLYHGWWAGLVSLSEQGKSPLTSLFVLLVWASVIKYIFHDHLYHYGALCMNFNSWWDLKMHKQKYQGIFLRPWNHISTPNSLRKVLNKKRWMKSDGCVFPNEQCCVYVYKPNGQLSVGEKVPLYA